jgi:membrane associated rhomboid family serine protease
MKIIDFIKQSILSRIQSMVFIILLIFAMWITFFIQKIYPEISNYGIIPRTKIGSLGIILSPFLHGNINHIYSNTLGLFLFGAIYSFFDGYSPKTLIFLIAFYSGLLVWLFAPNANYIGMSSVIFGLYGYLLMIGFFKKNIKHIIISFLTTFLYGSLLFTIISSDTEVASIAHVFGFITGCFWANFFQE